MHTDVHSFFNALLRGIKLIAMDVHTAFLITNDESTVPWLKPSKYDFPKSEGKQEKENRDKERKKREKEKREKERRERDRKDTEANRRKLSIPFKASKREATAPLLKTHNKFALLASLSDTDGAVASASSATPAPVEAVPLVTNMETTDPANVTVPERTAPKKEPRPLQFPLLDIVKCSK